MSGHSTRRIAIGYLTRASSIILLANTQNDCSPKVQFTVFLDLYLALNLAYITTSL